MNRTCHGSNSLRYSSIQNSIAHYNQMLSVKPVVDNRPRLDPLPNNRKYEKQVENERKCNNQLLLSNLMKIRDRPSFHIKTVTDLDFSRQKRPSLKNEFCEKEKERQVCRTNMRLYTKIKHVKPSIGSQSLWKEHEQKINKNIRLLRKSYDDQLSFERQVYRTFNELLYRDIPTKFKLVSDGLRRGEPIKVQVSCQLKKKRRRRTKKLKTELQDEGDIEIPIRVQSQMRQAT